MLETHKHFVRDGGSYFELEVMLVSSVDASWKIQCIGLGFVGGTTNSL